MERRSKLFPNVKIHTVVRTFQAKEIVRFLFPGCSVHHVVFILHVSNFNGFFFLLE